MRLQFILLCCLCLAACSGGGPSAAAAEPPVVPPTRYGIEIVVRTPTTLRNTQDVATLVDQAVRHGVAVINLMAKRGEDGVTRQRYQAVHGQDPATITFSTDNAERTRWNAWRTDGIARYVQRVRQAMPAGMAQRSTW